MYIFNTMLITDTSAKCNTVVHDNIWGTKCNAIVVTALLLWSYPGNGTKCDTMAGNGFWLWPWLRDHHLRFQVVFFLSIPSVPTLYLKDREWHNSSGTSFNGRDCSLEQVVSVLATQRQEELRQQLTIIYWNVLVKQ